MSTAFKKAQRIEKLTKSKFEEDLDDKKVIESDSSSSQYDSSDSDSDN